MGKKKEKNLFDRENSILSMSDEVLSKTNHVIENENISIGELYKEYIFLKDEYEKLLKDTKKITRIGDINQKKLYDANEKIGCQKDEIEKRNEELYEASIKDSLTKIYNRTFFMEVLEKEFSRTRRDKNDLSIIIFDADYFKRINDTYGHLCGDYFLKELVRSVENIIRKEDVFCRFGGEEFIIMLPDSSKEDAYIVAEKIRKSVEKLDLAYNESRFKVTISLGISDNKVENPKGIDEMINNADYAMYEAKRAGRNISVIYGEHKN